MFSYPSVLTYVLGAQTNSLIESFNATIRQSDFRAIIC